MISFPNQLITLGGRWPGQSDPDGTAIHTQAAGLSTGDPDSDRDLLPQWRNPYYAETAKQPLQVRQLLRGRIDGAVMELEVFNYYLRQAQKSGQFLDHELAQPVTHRHSSRQPSITTPFAMPWSATTSTSVSVDYSAMAAIRKS